MDDWKLKARAVVKLHRERNMFVSSYHVYVFRRVLRLRNHWLRSFSTRSDPSEQSTKML